MRLTRRDALRIGARFGGGALAATMLGGSAAPGGGRHAALAPHRPPAFLRFRATGDRTRFGALTFRAGVEINDPPSAFSPAFPPLCGSRDGETLIAVSDAGQWFAAGGDRRRGPISRVYPQAMMAPIPISNGHAARSHREFRRRGRHHKGRHRPYRDRAHQCDHAPRPLPRTAHRARFRFPPPPPPPRPDARGDA